MIARQILLYLFVILLADMYIDWRYLYRLRWWKRLLWWLPALFMVGYTIKLAVAPDFVPQDMTELNVFLFLMGLLVVPKAVFSICALCGHYYCKVFKKRYNYGVLVGLVGVLLVWYLLFYGSFVGFYQFTVKHVSYASEDLPAAFDGYRIVHFSDAHVGTLTDQRREILERAVDSINAQHADMIVFTGDLQNARPQELYPFRDLLATLKAKDGVFSVLGNHDYAEYIGGDDAVEKVANCRETQSLERQMGWTLLMNEHRVVTRGKDQIVVAGMENDGEGRFPQLGHVKQTLSGKDVDWDKSPFIVMLEHDPSSWRRKILPESTAQLTLSGHTHGAQFSLFGWAPMSLFKKEWGGMLYDGARALYVSTGLGGLVPFRFGMPGEIVVITLKKKTS